MEWVRIILQVSPKLDATDVGAGSILASALLAVYRYLSPTRRRLYSLETGQSEIKATLSSNHADLDRKISDLYLLIATNPIPSTRRRH